MTTDPSMDMRRIQISLPATGEEECDSVRESILSGWVTQGPKVAAFEKAFAEMHGVPHALAVTSCTTGLHLALAGLGIGPGDEVIVPAFTWIATANVVLYCGATPVFVDVDPATNNIDVEDVARKLTDRTRAVIPVHLFGLCADMDGLREVVPSGVFILEDAACAAGASYKGTSAGALGDVAAFSFHPRKSITTGEGGMITTRDADLADRMEKMRNHGAEISEEQRHHGPSPWRLPDFNLLGYNYRMTDLQGAIGLVQLGKLEQFIAERQAGAEAYCEAFVDLPWLRMPVMPTEGRHAWQAFVTWVDPEQAPMSRNEMMSKLNERGVATRPGTHAVHELGYYRERYGLKPQDFPNACACAANTMAIPLHNRMDDSDYAHVIEAIRSLS